MRIMLAFFAGIILLSICNGTNASAPEDERDWESEYNEAMIVESKDWGEKEYWEVDLWSERRRAMKDWDGKELIEHIENEKDAHLHIKSNAYLISAYEIEDNEYYSIDNGVLFSKDKSILYRYPAMKPEWYYQIPSSIKEISESAFLGAYYLRELVIPDSVTQIESGCVFYEACLERIHFPSSIISEFDVDDIGYMPYLKEIILPNNSPISDAIRDSEYYYMDLKDLLSFY